MTTTNRRELLKFAGAAAVAAGTGALIMQVTTAGSQAAQAAERPKAPAGGPQGFSETYRGRKIEIGATTPAPQGRMLAQHDSAAHASATAVKIDGVELHIMQNADGSYTSIQNHYETFTSLREVARAAVDSLGNARLLPIQHG
ncbi:tyrosinase family oxidase copper chaperone [Actinoplanes sp. NPDC051859]|uniref:tyrosinase family oxidase copper chaperone n=1 Tax=Actinoplanes sp. NPDC051859 TaxID=3363909 RepID=UPI003793F895